MHRLLLVDDEENVLRALRRVLATSVGGEREFAVEMFSRPEEALDHAEFTKFDLVLSDFRMPGMNGVEFLTRFRAIQPDAARMILSGYADLDAVLAAINEVQIFRFISKPWHDGELLAAIRQAIEYHGLLAENQRLADTVRVQQGRLSEQERVLRELEAESPGITKVRWGPNGEVMMDDMDL